MIPSKKIEAGCKAIIINTVTHPWFSGQIAHVGQFVGTRERLWLVSISGEENSCEEVCLLRIDDPDIQSQIEDETKIPIFVEAIKQFQQKYEVD